MTVDGAALLASAVRAAILAKAPRRTVQAVASAVTGVLVRPGTNKATKGAGARVSAGSQECTAANDFGDATPEMLLQSLKAARSAQRRRKKERRMARKEALRNAERKDKEAECMPVPSPEGVLEPAAPAQHVETAAAASTMRGSSPTGLILESPPPSPARKKSRSDHSVDSFSSISGVSELAAQIKAQADTRMRDAERMAGHATNTSIGPQTSRRGKEGKGQGRGRSTSLGGVKKPAKR